MTDRLQRIAGPRAHGPAIDSRYPSERTDSMRSSGWKFLAVLGTAFGIGLSGLALAHDGHDHGAATHGGTEAKTNRHHFEVVFTKTGLKLYAHGADHMALD